MEVFVVVAVCLSSLLKKGISKSSAGRILIDLYIYRIIKNQGRQSL